MVHTVGTAIYCFKLRQEICMRAYGELAPAHWTWSPIKLSGPSERSGAAAFITADSGLPPESRDCFGRESFSPYYPSSPSPLSIPFVFTPSAQQYVFVPFTSQHFYVPLWMSSRHRFWFVIDILRLTTGLEQLMHLFTFSFFFTLMHLMLLWIRDVNRGKKCWDKHNVWNKQSTCQTSGILIWSVKQQGRSLITFSCFVVNEIHNRCTRMRQQWDGVQNRNVFFQVENVKKHFAVHSCVSMICGCRSTLGGSPDN